VLDFGTTMGGGREERFSNFRTTSLIATHIMPFKSFPMVGTQEDILSSETQEYIVIVELVGIVTLAKSSRC